MCLIAGDAHLNLGIALQLKGGVPAAIAEYTKAQELSDDLRIPVLLATATAQSGDKDAAMQMLAELEELGRHRAVHAYWRVLLYLSLENRERAIRWLEQAVADHESLTISWIINANYRELVPSEEAERCWKIAPASESEKVVAFNTTHLVQFTVSRRCRGKQTELISQWTVGFIDWLDWQSMSPTSNQGQFF